MHQSEFLAITCNRLEARKKSLDWLWFCFSLIEKVRARDLSWSISQRTNHNRIITFEIRLKTVLTIKTNN